MVIKDGIAIDIEESDIIDGVLIIPEGVVKIDWGRISQKYPAIEFARQEVKKEQNEELSRPLWNSGHLDFDRWIASAGETSDSIEENIKVLHREVEQENETEQKNARVSENVYDETSDWIVSLEPPCSYESEDYEPKELLRLKRRLVSLLNKQYEIKDSFWGDEVFYNGYKMSCSEAKQRVKRDISETKNKLYSLARDLQKQQNKGNLVHSIKEIKFPDSLVSIGKEAFAGLETLESVVMPDSVVEIGEESFANCSKLKHVVLSRRLETIPQKAFFQCALEHVILPDSIKSVEECAFCWCPIRSLYMSKNLSELGFESFGGRDKSIHEVVWARDSGLEIVGERVQYNSKRSVIASTIEKLVLPPKYQEKFGCVEMLAKGGKLVYRSGADKKMGAQYGFIESEIDYSKLDTTKVREMSDVQPKRDKKSTSLSIGNVQVVGEYAFAEFQSLKSVMIEEGVKVIARGAFAFCPNLEKVVLPESLEYIDDYAFIGCSKLREIVPMKEEKSNDKKRSQEMAARAKGTFEVDFTGKGKKVDLRPKLPKRVLGIGDYAFSECESLKNIVCLGSIAQLGEGAFYKSGLVGAEFKGDLKSISHYAFGQNPQLLRVDIEGKTESIGDRAFILCTSLSEMELKPGLETIEAGAFGGCSNLSSTEKLVIPSTVKEIGEGAFYGCKSLLGVKLSGVKSIKPSTFAGCLSLRTVEFSEGTEKIEGFAFERCEDLGTVTLPKSMKLLESQAFKRCEVLSKLESYGKVQRAADTFKGCGEIIEVDLNELEQGNRKFVNGEYYEADVDTVKKNPVSWIKGLFKKKEQER